MLTKIARWMIHGLVVLTLCPFNVAAADTANRVPAANTQAASIGADSLSSGYLVQLVVGLMFVLLCIVALAWLAKRMNRFQSSSDGSLQILGGISMGARERVVLVQVGTTQLLLGVAPGRINMLHQLEHPLEKNPSGIRGSGDITISRGFAEKLNAALSRYK